MRKDFSPKNDVFSDFTKIRSAKSGKRRRILLKLEPWVFGRYTAFWQNLSTPENVVKRDWSKGARRASHEALLHCYTSGTDATVAIFGELADATRPEPFRCPYCLMRQPKTWDHFLAKEDFPEFATLGPNLIRACSTCNQKKLRHWTNVPRQVIHPYHDPIPAQALLWCDVTISQHNKLKLDYYIFRDPQVPAGTLDLFERHLKLSTFNRT